jgi:hypothetical protein
MLMVGLDGPSKSALCKRVGLAKKKMFMPTPGYQEPLMDSAFPRPQLEVWDVGGHYYAKNRALVLVVDAMDEARVGEASVELGRLLFDDGMRGSRLLVLAYNHDLLGAMSPDELHTRLGLAGITDGRQFWLQTCSLVSGDGIVEGFDWLEVKVALSDADLGAAFDGASLSRLEEAALSKDESASYQAELEELISGMPEQLGLDDNGDDKAGGAGGSPRRAPTRAAKAPGSKQRRAEPSLESGDVVGMFEPGAVGAVDMERD